MRILIVDDAPVLRAAFAHVARTLGHAVCGEAADAESGIRLARDLAPDAVVLDGRLTASIAVQVARFRTAAPAAAVYVVAALGETTVVREAIAAGAAGALLRPFVRTQILATLGGN